MVVEAQTVRANGSSVVSAKWYAVVVGINDYSEKAESCCSIRRKSCETSL